MRYFIAFFVLLFSVKISSQSIQGKVYNEEKIPLSGVNIYFDGTTIATVTDAEGYFQINADPKANNILVVSFLGYQSMYLTTIDSEKPLNVFLEKSKNELKEVVVTRKDKFSRKQKMLIFKENFLGKTRNSKKVVIENEDEIYFKYDKKNSTLQAFCDNPLRIVNSSLGYRIDYQLELFEVAFNNFSINPDDTVSSIFAGVSRFEEIDNSHKNIKRRAEAYEGSQLQFFRNLASSVWGKEQFVLYKERKMMSPVNCFKISDQGNYLSVEVVPQSIDLVNRRKVANYDLLFDQKEQSNVIFETDGFKIYKYGNNSDIEKIIFSGKISEKKVADMLPLNYGI